MTSTRSVILLLHLLVLALLAGCKDDDRKLILLPPSAHPVSPGDRATDYLQGAPYSSLVVEIDRMEGVTIDTAATNLLLQRLQERCNKPPANITLLFDDVIPNTSPLYKTSYTVPDIQSIDASYHDQRTGGAVAVLYFVYLNGQYFEDTLTQRVLGISYASDAIAIMKDNITVTMSGNPTAISILERSVLVHEAGHLMGLVNNGVVMTVPHEDSAHPRHDSDANCVMFWSVETDPARAILYGIPNDFGANCVADLQAAGGR